MVFRAYSRLPFRSMVSVNKRQQTIDKNNAEMAVNIQKQTAEKLATDTSQFKSLSLSRLGTLTPSFSNHSTIDHVFAIIILPFPQ